MKVIGIDTGARGCGLSFFVNGTLAFAKYVKNPVKSGDDLEAVHAMAEEVYWVWYKAAGTPVVDAVAIEFMQAYSIGRQKGDQGDLLVLAAIGGAIAHAFKSKNVDCKLITYLPKEWKGQVPGDIMCCRIAGCAHSFCNIDDHKLAPLPGKLTAEEHARIVPCGKKVMHNVLDAIGVGLFTVGRLHQGYSAPSEFGIGLKVAGRLG